MFLKLHGENRIGFKKLTAADLGLLSTSHQTHIGLSGSVLTYLPNRNDEKFESIFVFEDNAEYTYSFIDRIENPDGTYRSPKVRNGNCGSGSIVTLIQTAANASSPSVDWYLIWFGLSNSIIVFFLFNENSNDYSNISKFGSFITNGRARALSNQETDLPELVEYIENKVNDKGLSVLKELEIEAQSELNYPNVKFKQFDLENAQARFAKIGRDGEEFISQYMEFLLNNGSIKSYEWHNKNKESGLPYDFSFYDIHNNINYLDVKTTGYDFDQKMIFSSQEIDFISTNQNSYYIFRVYKNNNYEDELLICNNFKDLFTKLNNSTLEYKKTLEGLKVVLSGARVAISPNNGSLIFKNTLF